MSSADAMPVLTLAALVSIVAVEPPTLPLQRLRLYETGVGYFERRGNVGPSESLTLPLPSSHLDDALKSLVVLEATAGVRIHGVAFESSVSEGMARAMAGLPEESEGPLAYVDLLASLKGSRVQVVSDDGKVSGRFVDIEGPFYVERVSVAARLPEDREPRGEPHYTIIVLDDDDAIRRIKTDHIRAIRMLDAGTAERLDVAATALSDQTARQLSGLHVQTSAAGRLGLGYIAEAPVWRTTYRVVMDPEQPSGELQAWALVHNDTDEDWVDVSVELANGRPASFLHPLAAPRYAARELVAPPEDLGTVPQLANKTVDSMWADGEGSYGFGGLGLIGSGGGGGGTGEGTIGDGLYGTIVRDAGGELGDLAELSRADGTESGALFLYRVVDPIDLRAHQSALLPLIQQDIEVESVTLFGVGDDDGLSVARIVNTTNQTLPPGTVSFFADGGFVGESLLDRLKPHERRFVAYGSELDVELEREHELLGERVTWLEYREGHIEERFVLESALHLRVHNRSGRTQRVYAALDVPRNAELLGDGSVELDFDRATETALCATRVKPGAEVEHELRAKSIEWRTHPSSSLATLRALHGRAGVPEAQRKILGTAIGHTRRAVERTAVAASHEHTAAKLERDLVRLRKDLAALGHARARSRARTALTRDLLDKERQIDTLRAAAISARADAYQARRAKRAALAGLVKPTLASKPPAGG